MEIQEAKALAPGEITEALQKIQTEHGYLPEKELEDLALELELPLSRLFSLVTFFSFFRLTPQGDCRIQVCEGTACHILGAGFLSRKFERDLGVTLGGVTEDRAFGLEAVHCLGCCSLAPVVRVNDTTYGRVHQKDLTPMLEPFQKKGAGGAD